MAKMVRNWFVCDMPHDTETAAGEEGTVTFSLGGADYDIDLCALDGSSLRRAFAKYAAFGRRITGGQPARTAGRRRAGSKAGRARITAERNALCEWGAAQNPPLAIGRSGKVAAAVLARYAADRETGRAVPPPAAAGIPAATFRAGG